MGTSRMISDLESAVLHSDEQYNNIIKVVNKYKEIGYSQEFCMKFIIKMITQNIEDWIVSQNSMSAIERIGRLLDCQLATVNDIMNVIIVKAVGFGEDAKNKRNERIEYIHRMVVVIKKLRPEWQFDAVINQPWTEAVKSILINIRLRLEYAAEYQKQNIVHSP